MKVNIYRGEAYPVYSASEHDETFYAERTYEMSDQDWVDYQRVESLYSEWQAKLKAIYEAKP